MQLVVINPQKSGGSGYESGHIRIHNGTLDDIPDDWVLCDGQNGTPPLVDRAIVGAGGQYQVNQVFGADSKLTQTHTLSEAEGPLHQHVQRATGNDSGSGNAGSNAASTITSCGIKNTTATTGFSGGGEGASHNHGAIDVRQKSIAVIWIMKL